VTETSIPVMVEGGGPATSTRSWNLGNYVLVAPTYAKDCNKYDNYNSALAGTKPSGVNDDSWNSLWTGGSLSACPNLVNVANTNWQPTYTATDHQNWAPADITDTVISTQANNINDLSQGGSYDPHYLLGNYYQWNTATAGSGATVNNTAWSNAPQSICPKNWTLPVAKSDTNTSYAQLLYAYNFTKNPGDNGPLVSSTGYNIAAAPLYFPRDALINIDLGSIRGIGMYGHYWTKTITSNSSLPNHTDAITLHLNHFQTYPIMSGNEKLGMIVRCVVQ